MNTVIRVVVWIICGITDRWNTLDNGSLELDRLNGRPGDFVADEYGDLTHMWEYLS